MKAENILKTDVLDIIFQNKNKAYGAYELRKFYPNRLKKSIGITALLVLIFAGLQSWKTSSEIPPMQVGPVVIIDPYKPPIEKSKEVEKTKPAAKKVMEAVVVTTPVIVKEPIEQILENSVIDTSFIGNTTAKGPASIGVVGEIPEGAAVKGGADGKRKDEDGEKKDGDEEPIINPSQMPEFPGGITALQNFMMRNLKQPDDIDEGQKIVIMVKFVVDKNGDISNVQIIQNGREDLDDEVIRVINKMPNWKPGLQNGLPVAVYFRMPITFINNN